MTQYKTPEDEILELNTPKDLLGLSDENFWAVVNDAVRGRLDDGIQVLIKHPKVIDRLYLTLVSMKKSVEGQLGAKRADNGSNTSQARYETYRQWRAGALRFKSGVDQWLMIVRSERERLNPGSEAVAEYLRSERTNYLIAYENLRNVIVQHRDHRCGPECDDECVADLRLWQSVEQDMAVGA